MGQKEQSAISSREKKLNLHTSRSVPTLLQSWSKLLTCLWMTLSPTTGKGAEGVAVETEGDFEEGAEVAAEDVETVVVEVAIEAVAVEAHIETRGRITDQSLMQGDLCLTNGSMICTMGFQQVVEVGDHLVQ